MAVCLVPVYDSLPRQDERAAGYPTCRGISARTRKTIQHRDLRAGMNVLDAGCGPGRLTIPVAQIVDPCREVTAVDLQEGILSEAQERAPAAHLTNIRFLLMGIGEGKLEPDRFDRAVLITVLARSPIGKQHCTRSLLRLSPAASCLWRIPCGIRISRSGARSPDLPGLPGLSTRNSSGTGFPML
jgi:predicted RNA methylase